jgi:hypothetical protein
LRRRYELPETGSAIVYGPSVICRCKLVKTTVIWKQSEGCEDEMMNVATSPKMESATIVISVSSLHRTCIKRNKLSPIPILRLVSVKVNNFPTRMLKFGLRSTSCSPALSSIASKVFLSHSSSLLHLHDLFSYSS